MYGVAYCIMPDNFPYEKLYICLRRTLRRPVVEWQTLR
jgi:hypothetical protein